MIDIGEELPYITLEHPHGSRIIAGNFARKLPEPMHRPVCSLVFATRVRIVDELAVEERVQRSVERVMHQPIPHGCLVDVAWFGIVDSKCMVWPMPVGFLSQLPMERHNVVHKMQRKRGDILSISLSAQEFLPCREQILYRDDMLVCMKQPPPRALSLKARRLSIESKRDI